MSDNATAAMSRALKRAAYERMAALLQDPLSADAVRYLPPGATSSRSVALLTRLLQLRARLWADLARLCESYPYRLDELEVVIPAGDLPLPDNAEIANLRFLDIRLRVGAVDDTYRVQRAQVIH